MSILTLNSTFADIKKLLSDEDICFKKTIEKTFEKVSKNEELKNAFCFFMAMALGGVGTLDEEGNVTGNNINETFLKIIKINGDKWSKYTRKFVHPTKEKRLGEKHDKLLSKAHDTSLGNILKNGIESLKYTDKDKEFGVFDKGEKDKSGKTIRESWWFDPNKKGEKGQKAEDGIIPERVKQGINDIIDCLIEQMTIENTPQYNLLLSNKQLIMNGAPGTGKTYSARNIIADILFDTLCESENKKEEIKKVRMDMVQFHPSYDYTDFIDGIRPNLSGNELKYSLKNGSFKSFCRRAGVIERILAAGKKVDAGSIEDFLIGEDESIKKFWESEIEKGELKKEIDKVDESKDIVEFDPSKLPSFLFIIDEINRAEISKVLGEIMYCLDPDYRGIKGMISTQYSALATDETFFINKDNDKFFIPSNVYIIGTMNDIDRSVEVFDFALRRRFAWYEVKPDKVMDDVLKSMGIETLLEQNYENYKTKIDDLNDAIVDKLKLSKHYYLGPSYFAKIKLYYDEGKDYKEAVEKVWDNHISQILNEYVKGRGKENEVENIRENFISNISNSGEGDEK
jgi:ATPase associated with various cellular activities AAA_5